MERTRLFYVKQCQSYLKHVALLPFTLVSCIFRGFEYLYLFQLLNFFPQVKIPSDFREWYFIN